MRTCGASSTVFDPGVLRGRGFGQIYCVAARPGHVRGNHRHHRKFESFVAISGRGQLVCWINAQRSPEEDPQAISVPLDGAHPERVIVLPGAFHRVVPEGNDILIFLALTDEKFNPDDPDTEPWPAPIDWGQVYLDRNDPIGDSPQMDHFGRSGTVPNRVILGHSGTDLSALGGR